MHFFAVYHGGKVWKSVNVCLNYAVMNAFRGEVYRPTELPPAGLDNKPKDASPGLGGGVNACCCSISCWHNVKIRECLLKLHNHECIWGGNVWLPLNCCPLGQAMHRKACCLALAEA